MSTHSLESFPSLLERTATHQARALAIGMFNSYATDAKSNLSSFPVFCSIHLLQSKLVQKYYKRQTLQTLENKAVNPSPCSFMLLFVHLQAVRCIPLHTLRTSCRDCGSLALARGVVKFSFICISIVLSSWLTCGITAVRCEDCDITTSIYREEGSSTITTYSVNCGLNVECGYRVSTMD